MSTRCLEASSVAESFSSGPETTLVVKGSSHDGKVVRLSSKIITIGSSPNCNLRLVAKGVKPLHGFLIRGRARTVYRACEGQLSVNGTPALEGVIQPGDSLEVGPVQFIFMPPGNSHSLPHSDLVSSPPVHISEENPPGPQRPSIAGKEGGRWPRIGVDERASGEQLAPSHNTDPLTKPVSTNEKSDNMDIRTNVASPEIDPAIVAEMQSEMTRLRQAVDELANTLAEVQASLALWKHETQRRFETFSVVIPDLQIAIQETRQRQSVIEGMVSQVSSEAERLDRLAADLIRRQLDLAGERSGLDAKSAALAFREESLSRTPPCFQGGPADNAPTHGVWQSTGRDEIPGTFLEENDISHGANECRRDALKPRSGERVETFAAPVDASDPIQAKPQERPACGVSLYFQEDQRDQIKSEEQAILVRDRIGNESFPKEQSNREAAPVDRDRSDLHSSAKAFDESDREHQVVIQDYVARLLKKTTSDQPEKGETRQSSGECAPRKDVISGSGSPNQTDGNAARRRTAVSRQWGFVRKRAQAPEKNTNFAAMRELANLSSQAAIDRYAKAKLHKVLRGKLLVLLVCLVCGVGLGTLDLWLGIGPLGRAAIVLDFIVMVVYGIQYGLLTGRLIINPKGQLQLAERRIGREMRKLLPVAKPSLVESNASDVTQKRVSSGVAK